MSIRELGVYNLEMAVLQSNFTVPSISPQAGSPNPNAAKFLQMDPVRDTCSLCFFDGSSLGCQANGQFGVLWGP